MTNTDPVCLLLVEDDVLVRMTVALMLEDDGFKVVEASSAAEAMHLMRQRPEMSVVVTDIDLGAGPSGLELADAVHEMRPDAAVIFITGRVASMNGRELHGQEAMLSKPFECSDLTRLVREMTPR